jgi:hypothetical protein
LDELNSDAWKDFIGYILSVANFLTGKTDKGFKFSSLTKLSTVKSPNNPATSLLHYCVETIKPELLQFIMSTLKPTIEPAAQGNLLCMVSLTVGSSIPVSNNVSFSHNFAF